MRTKMLISAATAAGIAIVLSGCSSDSTGHSDMPMMSASANASAPSGGIADGAVTRDAAAIMFAQMMIPHHEQAIEMSDIALKYDGTSPAVRELATQIKAAQQPEIDQMTSWLEEWGMPWVGGMMEGHSMGGGMMSDADMNELENVQGAAFNTLWLELMIEHHEGAIDMAEGVLSTTEEPRVIALANAIIESQAKEIATMRSALQSS